MEPVAVCSERALTTWEAIKASRFSPEAHAVVLSLKEENYFDYCAVLGLIFDIAVYRNDELPESARGPDPCAYCVTVPSFNLDLFAEELPEGRDPAALWVQVAEQWGLAKRFGDACREAYIKTLPEWAQPAKPPTETELSALRRLIAIAKSDTGQSRRVAEFLLAWWNAGSCGSFDLTNLWAVDRVIADDMQTVFGLVARVHSYPDKIDPEFESEFKRIIEQWRPELLEQTS